MFRKFSGPSRQVVKGNVDLDTLDWIWKMTKQGLMPIEMTKKLAPTDLLKIVKCGCQTDCPRRNCTCRQYGVECTDLCLGCRGVSCLNSGDIDHTEL